MILLYFIIFFSIVPLLIFEVALEIIRSIMEQFK